MFLLDRTSYLRFWVLPSHFIGLYLYFLSSFVDIIVTHFPCFVNTFLLFFIYVTFFLSFLLFSSYLLFFIPNSMLCNVWFLSYNSLFYSLHKSLSLITELFLWRSISNRSIIHKYINYFYLTIMENCLKPAIVRVKQWTENGGMTR